MGRAVLRVKSHRYLYRRGEQLVFRRAVPEGARVVFGGRHEVQVSLGTSSVPEARHLLSRELAKFEEALSAVTGVRSPSDVLTRPVREPSVDQIEEAVREWFAERVERVQREADRVEDHDAATSRLADYGALAENVADGMRIGGIPSLTTAWAAEALMDRHGWRCRWAGHCIVG